MAVHSTVNSKVKISASTPASFDETGYAALTFTQVGEITDFGTIGRKSGVATHTPVDTGVTQKFKTSFDEGEMTLSLALDTADAGQVLMEAARDSKLAYSFEITIQEGTKFYFQALVTSFDITLGTVESITNAASTLQITSSKTGVGVIKVLAD